MTGEATPLNECRSVIRGNELIERCEHYKYVPSEEYLKKRGLGEEYLSAESTHIVCGYDGPIHENWEEWGLDPKWGLFRGNAMQEDKRKEIIKRLGGRPAASLKEIDKLAKNSENDEIGKTQMRLFKE